MGKLASTAKSKIKDKINVDFKLLISFNKHAKKKRILSLPSFIHLNKIWTFTSTGFSTVCHMCEVKSN